MSPGGGFEVTVKGKNNNPVPNAVVTALKDMGDGSRVSGGFNVSGAGTIGINLK